MDLNHLTQTSRVAISLWEIFKFAKFEDPKISFRYVLSQTTSVIYPVSTITYRDDTKLTLF